MSFKDGLNAMVVEVKRARLNEVVKPEGRRPLRPGPRGEEEAGNVLDIYRNGCTGWGQQRWHGKRTTPRSWTHGMQRGRFAPTYFWDEGSRTRVLPHGDDFVVAWPKEGVDWVKWDIKRWYGVKVRAVRGRGAEDDIVVLGRTVSWGEGNGRVGA